ncbi:hypothetical protein [Porphyromonas sp.]
MYLLNTELCLKVYYAIPLGLRCLLLTSQCIPYRLGDAPGLTHNP